MTECTFAIQKLERQYCNSKCVSLLLSPQDGETPLYIASHNGHTDVVRILLENEANPNISDAVSYSIIPFNQ